MATAYMLLDPLEVVGLDADRLGRRDRSVSTVGRRGRQAARSPDDPRAAVAADHRDRGARVVEEARRHRLRGVVRPVQHLRRRPGQYGRHRHRVRLRVVHRVRGDSDLRRGVEGPAQDRAPRDLPRGHRDHRDLRVHRLRHRDGPRAHAGRRPDRLALECRRRATGQPRERPLLRRRHLRRLLDVRPDELAGHLVAVRRSAGVPELRSPLLLRDGSRRASCPARSTGSTTEARRGRPPWSPRWSRSS